jgi:hypothetical protein
MALQSAAETQPTQDGGVLAVSHTPSGSVHWPPSGVQVGVQRWLGLQISPAAQSPVTEHCTHTSLTQ